MNGLGEDGIGRAFRAFRFPVPLQGAAPSALKLVPSNPWPGDAARGRAMLGGAITLAGETVAVEGSPWSVEAQEPWLAALHGFDWLRDLHAVGGDSARRHARTLTLQWLDRRPRRGDIALNPDVMGARIANWLFLHDFFCASADDSFRSRLFAALARQARALARALPGELEGARLLLAVKGLMASGVCLEGGEARFALAEKLLIRELPRQILPDGCHVERSPHIHAIVLAALIDMRALYKSARIAMPEMLQHAIDRMAPMLRFFRHGDRRLALFNGSQEGDSALLDLILAQGDARGKPPRRAPHAGFDRMAQDGTVVIVDSGIPPAPGFDRRAHAGIGSFEMSVGRERFIVNCGAHPGAGPWRAALAATAAHSTVTVADTNQFELIDGGGVRRRPQPTETKREDGPGSALVEITHNGYAGLGVLHRRRLFLCDNGNDFRGEDVIAGSAAQPFTIRFHLHPDVQASLTGGGNAALMRLGDGAGWRFRCGVETLSLEKGIYFGTGSAPRGSTVLVITGESRPGEDSIVRWRFHRDKRPLPQSPD